MNNETKEAIDWLLKSEYGVNIKARDYCIEMLEKMDKVKFVTDEDISKWITEIWSISKTPNSNKSLAVELAKWLGNFIYEEPRCRWTNTVFTTNIKMTEKELKGFCDDIGITDLAFRPVKEEE